jgi:hypothetical protein
LERETARLAKPFGRDCVALGVCVDKTIQMYALKVTVSLMHYHETPPDQSGMHGNRAKEQSIKDQSL